MIHNNYTLHDIAQLPAQMTGTWVITDNMRIRKLNSCEVFLWYCLPCFRCCFFGSARELSGNTYHRFTRLYPNDNRLMAMENAFFSRFPRPPPHNHGAYVLPQQPRLSNAAVPEFLPPQQMPGTGTIYSRPNQQNNAPGPRTFSGAMSAINHPMSQNAPPPLPRTGPTRPHAALPTPPMPTAPQMGGAYSRPGNLDRREVQGAPPPRTGPRPQMTAVQPRMQRPIV